MKRNVWIEKVILWSTKQHIPPRVVEFENNKVNIIYGDSKTGKSALIPIIDYCLGSGDCRIPIGIIRESVSWYGVVLKDGDDELLLCRADPGNNKRTSDMYFELGKNLSIPKLIIKNTTTDMVKDLLNRQFGFSAIPSIEQGEQKQSRSSFRDAAAVLYQPQNIIANPEALFYKLDTMEHKFRFSKMFPYLVGAITGADLANKIMLESVEADLKRLQREAEGLKRVSATWKRSAEGKITQAIELGISTYNLDLAEDFSDLVGEIGRISSMTHTEILKCVGAETKAAEVIAHLGAVEVEYSKRKADINRRLRKIDEALISYSQFDKTVGSLSEYAGITSWLLTRVSGEKQCPICGQQTENVATNLEGIQALSDEIHETTAGNYLQLELTNERATLSAELRKVNEELKAVSDELRRLEESQNAGRFQLYEIERFVGELRASLDQYEAILHNPDSYDRLAELEAEKKKLERDLNTAEINEKTRQAIESIADFTETNLQHLDVENSNWRTSFNYKDMTLQIRDQTGTARLLSEIGSASNWLSYHVAFSLAIQRYLQIESPLTIPGFLFYDQPSQVYFPHEMGLEDSSKERVDHDKEAVRKIFKTFDSFIKLDELQFQILVTEHAGEDIWGGLSSVHVVEHWTSDGKKLIPDSWIDPSGTNLLTSGNE